MTDSAMVRSSVTGEIREIRLGREDALCTLSSAAVDAMLRELESAARCPERVIVIRSAHRAFCGGFDLAEPRDHDSTRRRFLAIQGMLDGIRSLPIPTIAFVDGAAVGAGADLALSCDYRLGTARASFRFPGPRFGVILGTDQLIRRVGARRATDILLRDERVQGEAARECGLLTHTARDAHALDEFARTLVKSTRDLAPDVVTRLLEVIRSEDRSRSVERLKASMDADDFDARLDAFAARVLPSPG